MGEHFYNRYRGGSQARVAEGLPRRMHKPRTWLALGKVSRGNSAYAPNSEHEGMHSSALFGCNRRICGVQ